MKIPIELYQEAQAHLRAGNPAAAERCYGEAVSRGAREPDLHAALASVQQRQGKLAEAAKQYRLALELQPDHFAALSNLGVILRQLGDIDGAEEFFQRATEARPDSAEAHCNLGLALNELERARDAERSLRRALALAPDFAPAHYNLGNTLCGLGRYDEAILSYRRAVAISPEHHDAHWNLAHVLLLREQWHSGWEEFEHRWHIDQLRHLARRFAQPLWSGQDVSGKTVYLYAEQGYGDAIQFVRYAPLLAERGARVVLQVPRPLQRLCASLAGIERMPDPSERPTEFDYYCPLMSLARGFDTTLSSIPARIPYLAASPELRDRWARKLGPARALRVGLVWSSGLPGDDPNQFLAGVGKSMPLAMLGPLAQVKGIELHSLQKGGQEREAGAPPGKLKVRNWGPELADFADTAALIAQLDLVITVDTAVAHLAGALGKRAWVLLKFQHCWRWLQTREDSPWYPTLRLFRQPGAGDWPSVIGTVAEALRAER